MKYQILKKSLFAALFAFFSVIVFAQTDREKGIESYKQGNYKEAIIAFKSALKKQKNDAELQNYLGLSYLSVNEFKEARKSFEKAVSANPENSTFRTNLGFAYFLTMKLNKAQSELAKAINFDPKNERAYFIRGKTYLFEKKLDKAIEDVDMAIRIEPNFAEAYLLKSDLLLNGFGKRWSDEKEPRDGIYLLEDAVKELQRCSTGCLTEQNSATFKERLQNVQSFIDFFSRKKQADNQIPIIDQNDKTPIKFLYKPAPQYTDVARQNNEKGNVTLAILFGADAEIKYIIVLEGLNFGLTEQAIAAARQIKFEPELYKGEPVASVKRLQYNFDIY